MHAHSLAWQPPLEDGVHYPDSDGKPLGETGYHVDAILVLKEVLDRLFRRRRVFVAADMFFYFEKGNPRASKAPDVMAIKGVSRRQRRSYKLWVEGKPPSTIFEMISKDSRSEDLKVKPALYARLGVAEYFIFDPLGEILDPPFMGYCLEKGLYVPLPLEADGGLTSNELGLRFVPEGTFLRVIDRKSGRPVPFSWELGGEAEEQKRRADDLEAEVRRLREQLRRRL